VHCAVVEFLVQVNAGVGWDPISGKCSKFRSVNALHERVPCIIFTKFSGFVESIMVDLLLKCR